MQTYLINTPLSPIKLSFTEDKLKHLEYIDEAIKTTNNLPPIVKQTQEQIQHFINNPQVKFTLHYELTGTPFQRRVWEALTHIPAGKTKTYGELAKQLNTSARAIGNACRRNPIPIIVPCHRIVAQAHLGGYAGAQQGKLMEIKKRLLKLEGCDY